MIHAQPANSQASVMGLASATAAALLPTVGCTGCVHWAVPLPTTPGAQHLGSKRWAGNAPSAEYRRKQGPQRVCAAPQPDTGHVTHTMPVTWPAVVGMHCSQVCERRACSVCRAQARGKQERGAGALARPSSPADDTGKASPRQQLRGRAVRPGLRGRAGYSKAP